MRHVTTNVQNFFPGLVHRFYTMNPKTERLLNNSVELEPGMTVLVAAAVERFDIVDMKYRDVTTRVLAVNRWCTVDEDLETYSGSVRFTGIYEDGRRVKRYYDKNTAWIAKIDPRFESPKGILDYRHSEIEKVVLGALEKLRGGNEAIVVLASEAADKIMEIK